MENLEILFKKKAYEVLCNFVLFGYPSYPTEIFPFAHLSFCEQIITRQSCVVDGWDQFLFGLQVKCLSEKDKADITENADDWLRNVMENHHIIVTRHNILIPTKYDNIQE